MRINASMLAGEGLREFLAAIVCLLGIFTMALARAQSAPVQADIARVAANGSALPSKVSATGATTSAALEEIVVTAQKRTESMQIVPIAVTALNATALQNAGVEGTMDLPKAVPGLSFNTQLGGLGQPRIRGVGTSANGPGLENSVAIYMDDVYYGSAAGALFDLKDVAQVAVLKGPQGTLFGRNATGGLIQLTTKDPSHTFTADLDATYGNRQTVGLNAYSAGGLSDKVAAGIAFNLDTQEAGFGKNIPTDQDIQTHNSYATRGKLLFEPDSDTKFTLSVDYSRRRSTDFAQRVLGLELITGVPASGGPRDTNLTSIPRNLTKQYGFSLNGQHDFAGVKLVSVSAYRNTLASAQFDADQSPLHLIDVLITDREKQFSQELQLLSTKGDRLSWQAGVYYFWSEGQFNPNTTNTFFPDPVTFSPVHDLIVFHATERLNSYAAFGQSTYKLGIATKLTVGLRYTIDQRHHANDSTFSQISGFAFTAPTTFNTAAATFKKPAWRLALDHKLSDDILGYVSYNRGFKGGTFNANGDPAVPASHPGALLPETLDAIEAGVKSELFDHRVRFNAAAFYYKYKNIQVSQFSNQTQIVYNGDGATSYGLDADLTANITNRLTLNAGIGLIHGRYDHFVNAFNAVPKLGVNTTPSCFASFINPTHNPFFCGGNLVTLDGVATGNKLQNTPDMTFNIGGAYRIPSPIGELTLTGNYYYNSGYYSEPVNRLQQPSYGVIDASLGWEALRGKFYIRLWGRNLTDKLYAAQLAAVDTADLRIAAPGRAFGVTAGVHF